MNRNSYWRLGTPVLRGSDVVRAFSLLVLWQSAKDCPCVSMKGCALLFHGPTPEIMALSQQATAWPGHLSLGPTCQPCCIGDQVFNTFEKGWIGRHVQTRAVTIKLQCDLGLQACTTVPGRDFCVLTFEASLTGFTNWSHCFTFPPTM